MDNEHMSHFSLSRCLPCFIRAPRQCRQAAGAVSLSMGTRLSLPGWAGSLLGTAQCPTQEPQSEAEWRAEPTGRIPELLERLCVCDPDPHVGAPELLTLLQMALAAAHNFQCCRNAAKHILAALPGTGNSTLQL